jgi:thymidylate kinase
LGHQPQKSKDSPLTHPHHQSMHQHSISANPSSGELLAAIVRAMNSNKLSYCILRNYENLPALVEGDVDILLEPENAEACLAVIKDQCERIGAFTTFFMRMGAHIQLQIYIPGAEITRRILALDLQTGLAFKGIVYYRAKNVLARTVIHNGFCVPSPAMHLFCLLVHGILDKNQFKPQYAEKIAALQGEYSEQLEPLLSQAFEKKIAGNLSACLKKGDMRACLRQRREIIRHILRIKTCAGFLRYCYTLNKDRLQRLWSFPGTFIVLLGPDGSGKTTILDALMRALTAFPGLSQGIYLGSKKQLLPSSLKSSLGIDSKSPTHSTRPVILDFMAIVYHCARYGATYWRKIAPGLFRRDIMIGDRYYYDLFTSSYYKLPSVIVDLLLKSMPNPDLAIFLSNTPEQIYQRKQEKSLEQLKQQIASYRALGVKIKNWHEVSTAAEIDQTVGMILDKIMDKRKRPWTFIK